MKKIITLWVAAMLVLPFSVKAEKQHDLLQHSSSLSEIKQSLKMNQSWLPFPKTYGDRQGWDNLYGAYKDATIQKGEKNLGHVWEVVNTSWFLAFETTGDRDIMQNPNARNINALASLFSAEMAEGKGRFLTDIMDGTIMFCEMTSWALSAHLAQISKTGRSIPDEEDVVLELSQGNLAHLLACIYYYLGKEIDKINPFFSRRLYKELKCRELDPYLEREDYWWMGFKYYPDHVINNWNPWCNYNALVCFMMLENDPDRLARAVWKTMRSVDQYLNYVQPDGACEEGPIYWGAANGMLFEYLQSLKLLTDGKVNLLSHPLIKDMGEYVVYSNINKNWVVNFADAAPKGGPSSLLMYSYGDAVGSPMMKGYAGWLVKRDGKIACSPWGSQIVSDWYALSHVDALSGQSPEFQRSPSKWYPATEFCYLDNQKGLYLACKGGHNNESHNHNDIGTSIFFLDDSPILVDAGVGVYTKKTFSSERYTIWTMQSQYHNLPDINGQQQVFGGEYKSRNAQADIARLKFSLDISGAYPEETGVESWVRNYRLLDEELLIEDRFSLKTLKAPNVLNFLFQGQPVPGKAGQVYVENEGAKAMIVYDPKTFTANVETISIDDRNLKHSWGDKLYRLRLVSAKMQKKGTYTVRIKRAK